MRRFAIVLAIILAVAGSPGLGLVEPAAAAAHAPKVVLIVGPAGGATENYRELADEAAAVAAKYTPDVVRIYSPNATWPAVRDALQGASVVVYLGHGNGWPSRYRDELYPPTQNGFGLNPVAGVADQHQYFGESHIARDVKLAKNAVVVLSHLCYASGNTEPGLPEGTLDQAQQRVDNYAAGFIKAGAAAVIAEGHMGPAWYVDQILRGRAGIDRIWRDSPTFHGNLLRFESIRSPGYVAQMDPDNETSGFYRSIVLRSGLTAALVLSGAPGSSGSSSGPVEPSLAGTGVSFAEPDLDLPPTAGSKVNLTMKVVLDEGASLPASLTVGVRWDPVDVDPGQPAPDASPSGEPGASPDASAEPTASADPGSSTAPDASAEPEPSASPDASAEPEPSASPAASDEPAPSAEPSPSGEPAPSTEPSPSGEPAPPAEEPTTTEPAPVDLVSTEVPGDVVAPVAATVKDGVLSVPVTIPGAPGLYRLVPTLHDADGVAYDAATQLLVPALIVRVTGSVSAAYAVAPATSVDAGTEVELAVDVTNLGVAAWGDPGEIVAVGSSTGTGGHRIDGTRIEGATRALVVARWIDLGITSGVSNTVIVAGALPAGLPAGASGTVRLTFTAPPTRGAALVIIDVVTPDQGSLAALGVEPGLVRVLVGDAAAAPTPTPTPTPSATPTPTPTPSATPTPTPKPTVKPASTYKPSYTYGQQPSSGGSVPSAGPTPSPSDAAEPRPMPRPRLRPPSKLGI